MKIIDRTSIYIVCIKPSGALSTDEPGGMPELLRNELKISDKKVFSVHRLDRVVAGLCVYAVNREDASALSELIRNGGFTKEYLAAVHGRPAESSGTYTDLLFRDASENKTYVVKRMRKGVREAILNYELLGEAQGMSLVRIELVTGRTHQIRAQFSSRGMPLAGDRKYGGGEDGCPIALWSHRIAFDGKEYSALPPEVYPWTLFEGMTEEYAPEDVELAERRSHRESQTDNENAPLVRSGEPKTGKEKTMGIKIIPGDITKLKVDAIVNAANSSLLGGGGVDGCIHRAAGPELLQECRTLNGCATGDAKITKGYRLPAKYVIHAVGPRYRDGLHGEPEKLRSCYVRALELAKENGCRTVAFPLISGGIYGYPLPDAIRMAIETMKEKLDGDMTAYLVLFGHSNMAIAESLYPELIEQ